jgi:hypothetical protein
VYYNLYRVDKIISYADDVKLIGSFHYKKNNYHILKLLEPIFIVGKKQPNILGYYYEILSRHNETQANIIDIIEKEICKFVNDEQHEEIMNKKSNTYLPRTINNVWKKKRRKPNLQT